MGLKLGKKIEGGLRKLEGGAKGVERAATRGAQEVSTVVRDLSRGGAETASKGLRRLEESGRKARTKADQLVGSARAAAEELQRGLDMPWEAGMEPKLGRCAWQAQQALREARAASDELSSLVGTPINELVGRGGRMDLALPAKLAAAVGGFRELAAVLEGAAADAEDLVSSAQAFLATQGRDLAEVWESVKESELFRAAVDALARILMDKPTLHQRPEGCEDPVYYVNGMLTPLENALSDAARLEQCVCVLHNPTQGHDEDLGQAIYDRTWPLTLGSIRLSKGELARFLKGDYDLELQKDGTVRQLTHLVYHSDRPLRIVSHSQGCLQVRNALLTVALFRGQVRERVSWIAAGVPMLDEEILLRPRRFAALANRGDYVARWVGLRGGPGGLDVGAREHAFEAYAEAVRAQLAAW